MERPSTGGVSVAEIAVGGICVVTTENVLEQAIMDAPITIRPKNFLIPIFLGILEI
jgi:hypothetical protein